MLCGVEVEASHYELYSALLHAAVSLAGIALMQFHGTEREQMLQAVEGRMRKYIAKVQARQKLH
jgi:hypothetical protein